MQDTSNLLRFYSVFLDISCRWPFFISSFFCMVLLKFGFELCMSECLCVNQLYKHTFRRYNNIYLFQYIILKKLILTQTHFTSIDTYRICITDVWYVFVNEINFTIVWKNLSKIVGANKWFVKAFFNRGVMMLAHNNSLYP